MPKINMTNIVDELDPDQKAMLEQVREKLSDVLTDECDDSFLLRFLRARLFHEDDTTEMLRAHLRWRRHFSIDYFINDYEAPEFLKNYQRMSILGFSKDGSIIRILRLGNSDLKGLLLSNSVLDIETFFAYVVTYDLHLMKTKIQKGEKCTEKGIFIGDFDGLNVYDFPLKYTLSMLIRLVKIFEANFPEYLRNVYLINCPTVIYYVLKIIKPFMSEVTASKIHIYSHVGYTEDLLKYIDSEILPDFIGGTRQDTEDDNTCELLLTKTDKIPEENYFFNGRKLSQKDPEVTMASIDRRCVLEIDVKVPEEDYALVWEIDVQDYDLGFGISFKDETEESPERIKPVKRLKSQYSPFTGMHICDKPGNYVLVFDNSYSYFTDKTVLYKLEIRPPLDKRQ